ncbi:MAG: hypothetical protein AAGU74_08445 [Bacillota bacterium]
MGLIGRFADKVKDFIFYSREENSAKVPTDFRKQRLWNSVPVYTADEVALIVSKFILTATQDFDEEAAQYAQGSEIQRNTDAYASKAMATLWTILNGFEGLSDTPIGDRAFMDALDLSKERYQMVLDKIEGGTV